MKKYYCDWCGKETGSDNVEIVYDYHSPDGLVNPENKKSICMKCLESKNLVDLIVEKLKSKWEIKSGYTIKNVNVIFPQDYSLNLTKQLLCQPKKKT